MFDYDAVVRGRHCGVLDLLIDGLVVYIGRCIQVDNSTWLVMVWILKMGRITGGIEYFIVRASVEQSHCGCSVFKMS